MCSRKAFKEWLKHFTANAIAGVFHGLIGFSVALIIGAFIPVQIPIESMQQLIGFALTVGAGSGILGATLAVESEDEDKFKAGRVIKFIREAVYPTSRNNGARYTISGRYGLSIPSKKSWHDYILYI